MAASRPKEDRKANDKRERIVEAAIRVFAGKSFHTATVAEIAREAGVADGTIYLYFKSKEELLIRLFEEKMAAINEGIRDAVAPHEGALEKLKVFVRFHLRTVAEQPQLAEVLTVELRRSAKLMKEYEAKGLREYLKILTRILEQGQKEGSVRAEVDTKAVRRAIFGALDEVALAWLSGGRRFDLTRHAEQLAELFARGLAKT